MMGRVVYLLLWLRHRLQRGSDVDFDTWSFHGRSFALKHLG